MSTDQFQEWRDSIPNAPQREAPLHEDPQLLAKLHDAPKWFWRCKLCQLYNDTFPQHIQNCEKSATRLNTSVWEIAGPFFKHFHSDAAHKVFGDDTKRWRELREARGL